jgi:hypothetical protein
MLSSLLAGSGDSDVEKKTDLDFLSNLDRQLREIIENKKAQGR